MHRGLRGSTIVHIIRNSRLAMLFTRFRRAISRDASGTQDTVDSESGDSASDTTDDTTAAQSGVATGSLLFRLGARFGAWISGAWLYRWLTAEPEPDVIVIDLRETRLVGPVLAVLDWCVARLSTTGDSSLLAAIARRSYRLIVDRPVQLVSVILGGITLALVAMLVITGSASILLVGVVVLLAICAALGSRVTSSWADLRETRAVGLLVAAFEPPEPPDRDEEADDDSPDKQ